MKNRLDSFLDKIYENRGFYLRYLIVAALLGAVRYFLGVLMSGIGFKSGDDGLIAWFLWAALFYPPVKLWAFKNRCDNIYYLLTQIMVYIICVSCLWIVRSLILTGLVVLSSNPSVALGLGGVIVELICLALMINVVFKKKKS